jgi:hypothetical protein
VALSTLPLCGVNSTLPTYRRCRPDFLSVSKTPIACAGAKDKVSGRR